MHWENLEPLIGDWPLMVVSLALVGALLAGIAWIIGRPRRQQHQRMRRYWLEEIRWHARMKSLTLLNRVRMPRLTDQRDLRD